MSNILEVLGNSDMSGVPVPQWYVSAAIQGCHILIGAILAHPKLPLWLAVSVFSGWLGKELFADIVNADFATDVWFDSAADLACGAIGFFFVKRASS